MYDDPYIIKCCGSVKNWEFSIGDNDDIELQVWRPVDNSNTHFKLVGLNKFEVQRKYCNKGHGGKIVLFSLI